MSEFIAISSLNFAVLPAVGGKFGETGFGELPVAGGSARCRAQAAARQKPADHTCNSAVFSTGSQLVTAAVARAAPLSTRVGAWCASDATAGGSVRLSRRKYVAWIRCPKLR